MSSSMTRCPFCKKILALSAGVLLAGSALGAGNMPGTADVTIEKPYFRWRVLKTFAELSPTFARVYAGFADQSKEELDRFADYYDLTFRKAGTTPDDAHRFSVKSVDKWNNAGR